ncbi:hypothetical protein J6590_066381 [Homalodisca vitripennis]|nr:hypothetical protein J6590_066381 [Homalodisca vitripennis]
MSSVGSQLAEHTTESLLVSAQGSETVILHVGDTRITSRLSIGILVGVIVYAKLNTKKQVEHISAKKYVVATKLFRFMHNCSPMVYLYGLLIYRKRRIEGRWQHPSNSNLCDWHVLFARSPKIPLMTLLEGGRRGLWIR